MATTTSNQAAAKSSTATAGPPIGNDKNPEEQPKLVAPEGTLPSSVAAPGASIPHPASEQIDTSRDTPEVAEARARAVLEQSNVQSAPVPPDELKDYVPVECICKKPFYDKGGALNQPGATVYYTPTVVGERFPIEVLEPVDKAKADELRAVSGEFDAKQRKEIETQTKRREAFARLADETDISSLR